MQLNETFVQATINDGIGFVIIDNPPMNPLSEGVIDGIGTCLKWMKKNDKLRAVIITGKGDKAFVAGADIKEFPYWDEENVRSLTWRGQDLFSYIENFPTPIIAAINGYALGGGLELALCCDIRISSENAKFGLPEVTLGIIPGYGGTQRLVRAIPEGYAKMMIYTGEYITAEEAKEIGLIQSVVPQDKLIEKAYDIGAKIARNGPIAVREAKKAINYNRNLTIVQGLSVELDSVCKVFGTEDKREGVEAFIQKRPPIFKNK